MPSEPVTTVAEVLRAVIATLTTVDANSRPMDAEIDDARVLAMARAALPVALAQEEAVRALRTLLPTAETVARVDPSGEDIGKFWEAVLVARAVLAALAPQTTPEEK